MNLSDSETTTDPLDQRPIRSSAQAVWEALDAEEKRHTLRKLQATMKFADIPNELVTGGGTRHLMPEEFLGMVTRTLSTRLGAMTLRQILTFVNAALDTIRAQERDIAAKQLSTRLTLLETLTKKIPVEDLLLTAAK